MILQLKERTTKVVELLLKRGVKVDTTTIKSNICTPLHVGVIYECLDIVKLLSKSVSKVDAMLGSDLTTPLHLEGIADRSKHLEIAECFSKLVGKVDSTPPHMAAAVDEPDLADLLLKLRAKVDSTDDYGFTALHWATRNGCVRTVRALLEYSSDITIGSSHK